MKANYRHPASRTLTMKSGICFLKVSIHLPCQDNPLSLVHDAGPTLSFLGRQREEGEGQWEGGRKKRRGQRMKEESIDSKLFLSAQGGPAGPALSTSVWYLI